MQSPGWLAYIAIQTLLGSLFLLLPASRASFVLEVAIGWTGAAFVLAGSVRHRLPVRLVWWLLAAGLFCNAGGILVENLLRILRASEVAPGNPADLLFLAIFPCLIGGLAILVYRRSVAAQAEGAGLAMDTIVSTVITAALGVFAWELLIGPQPVSPEVGFLTRAVTLAYPLGDLIVIALLLRLFLLADLRNLAFCLMLAALLCFLGADIGWAVVYRGDGQPGFALGQLLRALSLAAFALTGAAVWHPSIARLIQAAVPAGRRAGPALWASLAISLLTAPLVLLIESLFDRIYGGGP